MLHSDVRRGRVAFLLRRDQHDRTEKVTLVGGTLNVVGFRGARHRADLFFARLAGPNHADTAGAELCAWRRREREFALLLAFGDYQRRCGHACRQAGDGYGYVAVETVRALDPHG